MIDIGTENRRAAVKARCRGLWLCGSLVFLILPQFGCESAARKQQVMTPHTYSASFTTSYWRESGGRLYIPLWMETPPTREIYRQPEIGIHIERLEVDGRTIPPREILMQGGVFGLPQSVCVDGPFFVYQFEADTWDYRHYGNEHERPKHHRTDYELLNLRSGGEYVWDQVCYRIPYNARRIRIEYRARYPVGGDDELGPLITVVADRDHDTVMNGD